MSESNKKYVMETFSRWFEGEWDNSKQAQMYPNRASFVHVIHEKVAFDEWRCSYRFHRSKYPYRDFTLQQSYENGIVVLKKGPTRMEWSLSGGSFTCSNVTETQDIKHFYNATLGSKHFFVEDQAWRGESQLWGLEEGIVYEFERSNLLRGGRSSSKNT